ncbi:MAG: hypothetical protein ACKVH0_10880 [Alphaproteobacteria bacterium]
MAIETRTIFFDQDELIQASFTHCLRRDLKLPPGRLVQVEASPEAIDRVRLVFDGIGREKPDIVLNYSEMAAALITHCSSVGIPLPRYSRKRLTPAGEGMALIIRLPEFAGEVMVEAAISGTADQPNL